MHIKHHSVNRCLIVACTLIQPISALLGGLPRAGIHREKGIEDFNPVFDSNGPDPIGINILGSGAGIATNLGQFTVSWDFDITFGVDPSPGTRHFVALNGDKLWTESTATGTPPDADPNFNQTVKEEHVITGGTGRFEGATGSFILERIVYDVRPGLNLETSGSFSGTIILVTSG